MCTLHSIMLNSICSNSDATALVTTGEGKFYSNGFDLGWVYLLKQNYLEEQHELRFVFEHFHKLELRLMAFPLPTVAAINGML